MNFGLCLKRMGVWGRDRGRETGEGEELKEKDLRGRERKEWQRECAIWRDLSAEECGGGRKRTVSYGFCVEYMS